MEPTVIYSTRVSAAEAAEQSRIATAEGLRQVQAALLERGNLSPIRSQDSDDSYDSSDSSDSEGRHRKCRRRSKKRSFDTSGPGEHEKRNHYLTLELANAQVDVENLRLENSKLKISLDPYTVINNELAYLKSSIDRSNKEINTLTLSQLEKRATLYKEEYLEHIALCNAAIGKLSLAEVKSSFMRVIVAEKKRAIKAENTLNFTIWFRKTTYKVSYATIVSVLVAVLAVLLYWKIKAISDNYWY